MVSDVIRLPILKDRRIFVVEDNVDNLSVIKVFLKTRGAIVFFERWGSINRVLYQIIQAMPLDIILLDLMLPNGQSGYDLFEAIRQVPGLEKIPVVLVTAADPGREKNRARALGFDGFISKPLQSETLVQNVADAIAGKPVWN